VKGKEESLDDLIESTAKAVRKAIAEMEKLLQQRAAKKEKKK